MTTPTMQDLLIGMAAIKEIIKNHQADLADREAALIALMESKGQKTISANSGDLKGTLVKGSRITIDEDALKKALPAAQWKKVTKTVLDKEKLEAHIAVGVVDARVVAAASEEKDVKPYVKVSGTFRAPRRGDLSLNKQPAKKVRPAKPRTG